MNKSRVALGVVFAIGLAFGAEPAKPKAKVEVFADRPNGLYGANDKVEFVVKVTNPDGTPATNGTAWVGVNNWGGKSFSGENFDLAKTANGQAAKRGICAPKAVALGEPGFLRCTVHYTAPGQDVWESGTVACDPRKIEDGTERP